MKNTRGSNYEPDGKHEVVGRAIRLEVDTTDNSLYLVFKVSNESFAKKVREDWSKEVPVKIIGKDLVLEKGVS